MATFIKEYKLVTGKDILKSDIILMCDFLKEKYGAEYDFIPESISEGGIVFSDFPEKHMYKHAYKTIRFNIPSLWPWLPPNAYTVWQNDNEILIPKNTLFTIDLRCFRGASDFNDGEISIVESCFHMVNLYPWIHR
mgnify:CR=1 FL=1